MMRWPWQHRCRHKPVGVQVRDEVAPGQLHYGPYTLALVRCSCGNTTVHTFPGVWSLAALQGVPASESVDALLKEVKP